MLKKSVIATAVSLVLLSASAQAASTNPTLHDQLSFRAGGFLTNIDTSVTINGEKFDFEEVLDDSVTTGSIQALWRVSNKLRLNFGYWAVNRDESESLGSSESIGGITVPAGSTVAASFDSSYLNAAIGYSFIRSDTTEFGADIGLAALGLKSELGAAVPGVGGITFTTFDETYPLPTIGLYVNHALSPKWSISGRFGGIGLDLGDDFKGTVIEANAAVEFRPWQNVGLGLAYFYNSADATLNDVGTGDGLDVEWEYQGPVGYLTLGF
jgi:opacity protein-like surface antigen